MQAEAIQERSDRRSDHRGVGMYPQIRADLRTNVPDLWVAGDAGGIFRGLTAALISGYSAGLAHFCF